MKSDLQVRAERAAVQFVDRARKPVVIEFAGVPKAGKTTTLHQVQAFLKRCGFRTEVVVERASVCPIRDKKHANFNVWTSCTTLVQLLENTQEPPRSDDPHILFLDRGIFDSICWLTMMEHLARIRHNDREVIEQFLRINDWRRRITGVIVMNASPRDAMKREKGFLPVEDTKGSIMNEEVLQQVVETTRDCTERLKDEFRIYQINTSSGDTKENPKRTAEVVADIVLTLIEEQIQEDILCIEKSHIINLFEGKPCLLTPEANKVEQAFVNQGRFSPRALVEQDHSLLQALPVVVVRNKSGDILRLRRREKRSENPLHQKVVIWAGGHVRKEDATNGSQLLKCAVRELEEELRLNIELSDLRLVCAIYIDSGGSTSKHVALAYEWRAETDDVAVALSSAEFFERRGTSLSGKFVSIKELSQDVENKKLTELWSVELLRQCLAKGKDYFSDRLF